MKKHHNKKMPPEPDKSSLNLKQKKIFKKAIFNFIIKTHTQKKKRGGGIKVKKY